jgi:hypothetical protein
LVATRTKQYQAGPESAWNLAEYAGACVGYWIKSTRATVTKALKPMKGRMKYFLRGGKHETQNQKASTQQKNGPICEKISP